jgi:hypothetical protein
MTTDFRALCAELLAAADEYAGMNPYMRLDNAMKTARAALAVEPEPPDAGEVAELVVCLHRLARADWLSDETADILTRAADLLERLAEPQPVQVRSSLGDGPAVPEDREPASVIEDPTAGEVAGLVAWLRNEAERHASIWPKASAKATRLAAFVERLAAEPEPVGPTLDDVSDLCEEFKFHLDGNGEYNDTLESAEALWEICRAVLARYGETQ